MIQLACNHCGHHFDLEAIEGAVCPSCGWSSSIVRASELAGESAAQSKPDKKTAAPNWFLGFLFFCFKIAVLLGIVVLIALGVRAFLKSRDGSHSRSNPPSVSSAGFFSKKKAGPVDIKPGASSAAAAPLSQEEESFLNTALQVSNDPVLSDQDLKLLQRSMDLEAAVVEKLPSAAWTAAEFRDFIAEQEKKFKMPLPRGYKKDLTELFSKTYATAYDLFLNGHLQQARDAYIASLAFPVYLNDLRKHRAVVLTMMRPFLNDTIAKVGAMNFALARQNSQSQSEQAGLEYARLQELVRASNWVEAMAKLKTLEALLPADAQAGTVSMAPPYGPEFVKVDDDMKPALNSLLQVPAWPFDVNALKGDLSVKKMILQGLTDPDRKISVQKYQEAMGLIQKKEWLGAASLLKDVKSPEDLAQDADDKLDLIERLLDAEKISTDGKKA